MEIREIISSPPSRSYKSIHNVRNMRKCKRKLSSGGGNNNEVKKKTYLEHLYQDSDDDDDVLSKTFLIGSAPPDNQFELEKLLIKADRITNYKKQNDLPPTQEGFQRAVEQLKDMEGSFVITDSELINCCNEADEMMTKTPPKELRLVNSILEEFSLSPLTTTEPAVRFWEYSPEFILKSIPSKTYSRINRTNKRLEFNESINSEYGDGASNNNSNISIQEDHSQMDEDEDVMNTTVTPTEKSERLSENLLNLSAFFTQRELTSNNSQIISSSETETQSNSSEILTFNNVVSLLKEICSLRKRSHSLGSFSSYNSDTELYGFSDIESEYIEEDISLSEDLCVTGRLDKTLLSPQSFHIPDEDREMVLCPPKDDNRNCEGFAYVNDDWNNDCPEVFALIKTQEVLLQQKNLSFQNNTSSIILEDPIKVHDLQNCTSFINCSSKRISKEPHFNASEICDNLMDMNGKDNNWNKQTNKSNTLNNCKPKNGIYKKENQNMYDDDDIPSTSNAANRTNAERLNKFEYNVLNNNIASNVVFGVNTGFHTAKGKNVNISSKAQKTVEKLLNGFYSEDEEATDNLHLIKNQINHKNSKHAKQICDEERNELWEDEIDLANVLFSEWPLEEQLQGQCLKSKTTLNFEKECKDVVERLSPLKCNTKLDGFQTANGRKVVISEKAQKVVANLLQEIQSDCDIKTYEENLVEIKSKMLAKNYELNATNKSFSRMNDDPHSSTPKASTVEHKQSMDSRSTPLLSSKKFRIKHSFPKDNVSFSEWPLEEQLQGESLKSKKTLNFEKECKDVVERLSPLKCNTKLDGFQTANGKKVAISEKAQKVVANLLQEIQSDCDIKTYEENLVEIKSKRLTKNYELNATNKSLSRMNEDPQSNTPKVSTVEHKRSMGSGCTSLLSPKKCLIKHSFPDENVLFSEWALDEQLQSESLKSKTTLNFEKECKDVIERLSPLKCNTKLDGFQTANGKKVAISEKAQKVVANLLQEIQSDCDIKTYEENLVEIKSKMLAKNYELNTTNKSLSRMNDNSPASTPKVSAVEHKRSTDSRSTPLLSSKKCLLKQSFSELSVISPLSTSATRSIISRKNLLSLSKKRKQKDSSSTSNSYVTNSRPSEDVILEENPGVSLEDHAETPVKKKPPVSASTTPWTPNINEFFNNASKSSTPRSAVQRQNDFTHIPWDASNTSISKSAIATKLSNDTCSNITLNSSNPTVNERIGRLQMYGDAPAISPILIDTRKRCRPSGLRRTRSSMLKKPPNN